jgi:ADP-dependent NAD(P)H-hydrate dehydratase / NAD(P)H-hydrate epimerase
MIPVVTPEEMKAIDEAAPEPTDVLVHRAGGAVARVALAMLGGTYGRRVAVVAGKGNNGADGRDAADRLRRRRVRVDVVDAAEAPSRLEGYDLVVDAAYGTGFHGEYEAPDACGAAVLAVDVPSGVDGLTGEAAETAVRADVTVTFAALKPGLLLSPGVQHAGVVEVADIGLDASSASAALVEGEDVAAWLPERPREAHKWMSAVYVVAGSPGMMGAAHLTSEAALRAGAGMVRLGSPGADPHSFQMGEVVGRPLPLPGWEDYVPVDSARARALVIGPGLGRDDTTAAAVRHVVARTPIPALVDADALFALGDADQAAAVIQGRDHPTVLTPHEGEFARLAGAKPGPDRLAAVRSLAQRTGAIVLLKGSTTVVGEPGGRVLLSDTGAANLATAGTGDVLSGVVGAFLALGLDGAPAGAAGAWVHGTAAHLGWRRGLVAGDLLDLLPAVLSELA